MKIETKIMLKRIIPKSIWKIVRKLYLNIKSKKAAKKILEYYDSGNNIDILNEEQLQIIKCIRKRKKVDIFNYELTDTKNIKIIIEYDKENKLFYAKFKDRKLYLRRTIKSKREAEKYILSIIHEQDLNSPHRYVPEGHKLSGNLVDIGAAEGWFAFYYQDEVDKITLIEYEDDWIEALKLTFKDRENVEIIKKYVSDIDKGIEVKLDTLLANKGSVGCIKMDIEGAEIRCISGAEKVIYQNLNCQFFICTYHKQCDEEKLRKVFAGRTIEMSNGYMLMYQLDDFEPPFFRKGVMRVL